MDLNNGLPKSLAKLSLLYVLYCCAPDNFEKSRSMDLTICHFRCHCALADLTAFQEYIAVSQSLLVASEAVAGAD